MTQAALNVIRRRLRPGDADAIVELQTRLYTAEYGLNGHNFGGDVRSALDAALARGWPDTSGAVWLLDGERGLAGSLALTDQGDGVGRLRWFVLTPELRGRGLGRELVSEARAQAFKRLELHTFSLLTVAARIYRGAGFRLLSAREYDDWGPRLTYQLYVLELGG